MAVPHFGSLSFGPRAGLPIGKGFEPVTYEGSGWVVLDATVRVQIPPAVVDVTWRLGLWKRVNEVADSLIDHYEEEDIAGESCLW